MKKAVIHSVSVGGANRFGWKWRAEDGSRQSADAFVYFYDCLQSAKKAGFECRFEGNASEAEERKYRGGGSARA